MKYDEWVVTRNTCLEWSGYVITRTYVEFFYLKKNIRHIFKTQQLNKITTIVAM
jgi:hypothetical protein